MLSTNYCATLFNYQNTFMHISEPRYINFIILKSIKTYNTVLPNKVYKLE